MIIRPIADYVLLRGRRGAEKTIGGLVIPESVRDRAVLAEVIAVGPGKWLEEAGRYQKPELQPGDVAVLVRWGVNRDIDGDPDLLLIRESEILAIVEDPSLRVEF